MKKCLFVRRIWCGNDYFLVKVPRCRILGFSMLSSYNVFGMQNYVGLGRFVLVPRFRKSLFSSPQI